jgi:hypothetical protein
MRLGASPPGMSFRANGEELVAKRSCGCAMRSLAALGMTWNSRRTSAYVIPSQGRGISLRLAEAFVWLCNEIPRCARDDMELSADHRRPVLAPEHRARQLAREREITANRHAAKEQRGGRVLLPVRHRQQDILRNVDDRLRGVVTLGRVRGAVGD